MSPSPHRPARGPYKGPVFTSQMLPALLGLVQAKGMDAAGLIHEFSLPPDASALPEVPIRLDEWRHFCEVVAERVHDPFMGLHAALAMPQGSYGLLEFVCRHRPTLGDAYRELVRFGPLLNHLVEFSIEERKGERRVSHRIRGEPLCVGRHSNEFTLARLLRHARDWVDGSIVPLRAAFAHPRPADDSALVEYFRCPLSFDRGFNALWFSKELFERRMGGVDFPLHDFLARQAQEALAKRPGRSSFIAGVQEELRQGLPVRAASIERIARRLRMSARTLQRRLRQEGTSFQALIDDVRRTMAEVYFSEGKKPLGEVAFMLGYSDLSAFTRAYRRWTGKPPRADRGG